MDDETYNEAKMDVAQAGGMYAVTLKAMVRPRVPPHLRTLVKMLEEVLGPNQTFDDALNESADEIDMRVFVKTDKVPTTGMVEEGIHNGVFKAMVERSMAHVEVISIRVHGYQFVPKKEAMKVIDDLRDSDEIEFEG